MHTTAARTGSRGRAARIGVAVLLAVATIGLLGVNASDAAGKPRASSTSSASGSARCPTAPSSTATP